MRTTSTTSNRFKLSAEPSGLSYRRLDVQSSVVFRSSAISPGVSLFGEHSPKDMHSPTALPLTHVPAAAPTMEQAINKLQANVSSGRG
jgi:hypothetical protein